MYSERRKAEEMEFEKPHQFDGPRRRKGNTRRKNLLHKLFNPKPAYVVREVLRLKHNIFYIYDLHEEIQDYVGDGLYPPENDNPKELQDSCNVLEYSLNKRKRWLIPDAVKNSFPYLKLEQKQFSISLYERNIPLVNKDKSLLNCFSEETAPKPSNWRALSLDCFSYVDSTGNGAPPVLTPHDSKFADLRINYRGSNPRHHTKEKQLKYPNKLSRYGLQREKYFSTPESDDEEEYIPLTEDE